MRHPKPADVFRVMTYNVHSCIGMDGRHDHRRIAQVIRECDPDIVALQELETGRVRSGGLDQAHSIAHDLEMLYHFHPSIEVEEEKYGDAILTRHHMRLVRAAKLPGLNNRSWLEPRGALWVELEFQGRNIQVLNTHLSLHPRERTLAAEALLGNDWLGNPACAPFRVLCGDFNAGPLSPVCRRLNRVLRDAQIGCADHRPKCTFYSKLPFSRIDHVYVDPHMRIVQASVPSTPETRVASDHLPLIVDLQLPE